MRIMSSPTPAPRDPNTTLDLIKETAWRIWVRHRHIPYNSNERDLFEAMVTDVWRMVLEEAQAHHQSPQPAPNGRARLVAAILTGIAGAVSAGAGTIQGDWIVAGVGAAGFLLGIIMSWVSSWRRK